MVTLDLKELNSICVFNDSFDSFDSFITEEFYYFQL